MRRSSIYSMSIDATCEEILLSEGRMEEAYGRYGLRASRGGTYLATFRAIARKYPDKSAGQILQDYYLLKGSSCVTDSTPPYRRLTAGGKPLKLHHSLFLAEFLPGKFLDDRWKSFRLR